MPRFSRPCTPISFLTNLSSLFALRRGQRARALWPAGAAARLCHFRLEQLAAGACPAPLPQLRRPCTCQRQQPSSPGAGPNRWCWQHSGCGVPACAAGGPADGGRRWRTRRPGRRSSGSGSSSSAQRGACGAASGPAAAAYGAPAAAAAAAEHHKRGGGAAATAPGAAGGELLELAAAGWGHKIMQLLQKQCRPCPAAATDHACCCGCPPAAAAAT